MSGEELAELLKHVVEAYGYGGAFLIALISNMVLFVPVPYLAAFFVLAQSPKFNLVILSILGGLGAALGKLFAYFIGAESRRLLPESSRRRLSAFGRLTRRYSFPLLILVAATPMPDDAFLIPFGMMRYDVIKYFLGCFLGKTALTGYWLLLSRTWGYIYRSLSWRASLAISVIGAIIILLAIFGINWELILVTIELKGLKAGGIVFLKEIYRVYNPMTYVNRVLRRGSCHACA